MPSVEASPNQLVSAVIPSRDAGPDLFRAIASVRGQTYAPIEVVVVLDNASPSDEVLARLNSSVDRLVRTSAPVGGSKARNLGIAAASGVWIALLDDDDQWADTKIERQIQAAAGLPEHQVPVVSTRVLVQQGEEQRTWPFNRPPATDPLRISEYLFYVSSPTRRGEGFVQTSTLFASKRLFEAVPFKDGLPIHQDWDWLLRAAAQSGFHLEMIWEPLTVYYLNIKGTSVSQTKDWRPSFAWASGNPLISRRAYSYFLATVVARYLPVSQFPRIFWVFLTKSRFDLRSILLFLVFFTVRDKYRLRAARWLRRIRGNS